MGQNFGQIRSTKLNLNTSLFEQPLNLVYQIETYIDSLGSVATANQLEPAFAVPVHAPREPHHFLAANRGAVLCRAWDFELFHFLSSCLQPFNLLSAHVRLRGLASVLTFLTAMRRPKGVPFSYQRQLA